MTSVDELWFLADEAQREAEAAYHKLKELHDQVMEPELKRRVSRSHFRRAVTRAKATGAPYGAQTLIYRPSGEVILVRHSGVRKWVLPGGEVDKDESFREAARREVREECGIPVTYEGLAMIKEVTIRTESHETWGIIPVYAAAGEPIEPTVSDPDDEVTDAKWFKSLPEDTRDREHIQSWRQEHLSVSHE